jgi:hypothetical protein
LGIMLNLDHCALDLIQIPTGEVLSLLVPAHRFHKLPN